MYLSVIGSGYVGTTVAAIFADLGHHVTCVDLNDDIVNGINAGDPVIHEPGLPELLAEHGGDTLVATTDYEQITETDLTFLALPTPSNEDGSIDRTYLEAGAGSLGEALGSTTEEHTVVVKSTVVPGTTDDLVGPTVAKAAGMTVGEDLHVGMNPEFQREGTAVSDFRNPDKIVFGSADERAIEALHQVYEPLVEAAADDIPIVETGTREAELIKYANNTFLATKVSFINELGNIAKEYDVDTYEVAEAMGLDHRISEQFLRSGLGWGGSCFPKDTNALIAAARDVDYDPSLLEATVEVNEKQPQRLLALLDDNLDVEGKRITVLGLAFKPGTDDIRNARSIPIIEGLKTRDADIVAYDPVATGNMQEHFPDIDYASSASEALEGSSAALIVTDWDEFSALDEEFERMTRKLVIDGRHVDLPIEERGLEYVGLCW
jgi:UDPglucose 6-dehydrogenase